MNALYRYVVSRHVNAAPQIVWDVVSDHIRMPQWTPYRRAVLEKSGHPHPNGVGAVRSLHLFGPPTREEIIEFEPPHRLRYRLLSGLPFRDYIGHITVEPDGTGSRLSTELCFRTRIPGTQFFGPIAIRIATRAAGRVAEGRIKCTAWPRDWVSRHAAQAPAGCRRALFRMPIYLYRLNLGWLFGHRLLLLNHIGRTTGKPRQTILEVLDHDASHGSYFVASGWGATAHWYRNIREHPDITVEVGVRTLPMRAELLSSAEGAEIFLRYAARHRFSAHHIWPSLVGQPVDGSDADFWQFARNLVVVRFVPRCDTDDVDS